MICVKQVLWKVVILCLSFFFTVLSYHTHYLLKLWISICELVKKVIKLLITFIHWSMIRFRLLWMQLHASEQQSSLLRGQWCILEPLDTLFSDIIFILPSLDQVFDNFYKLFRCVLVEWVIPLAGVNRAHIIIHFLLLFTVIHGWSYVVIYCQ